LGADDRRIAALDTDGVILSALKGLLDEWQERTERSAAQAKRLDELQQELRLLAERLPNALPPSPAP
jgi:type II secretory pathway component PulJ